MRWGDHVFDCEPSGIGHDPHLHIHDPDQYPPPWNTREKIGSLIHCECGWGTYTHTYPGETAEQHVRFQLARHAEHVQEATRKS